MEETPPTSDDETGCTEEVSEDGEASRPRQVERATSSQRQSTSSMRQTKASAVEEGMHQWVYETSQTARLNMLFVPEKVPRDTVGRQDQVLGYRARDKQLEPLAAQMEETKLVAKQLALACQVVVCPRHVNVTCILRINRSEIRAVSVVRVVAVCSASGSVRVCGRAHV